MLAYLVTMTALAGVGSTHPDRRTRVLALGVAAVGLGVVGYIAGFSIGLPLLFASILAAAGAILGRRESA